MDEAGWGAGSGDPAITCAAQAMVLLQGAAGSLLLTPTLAEVEGAVADAVRLSHVAAAHQLHLVRGLLARHAQARYPAAAVRAFLCRAGGISSAQANRMIAAALATGPAGPLARMGAALAQGRLSREHVDAALALIKALPGRVWAEHGQILDEQLTQWSGTYCPAELKTLTAQLLATLNPRSQGDENQDAEGAFARRHAEVGVDGEGMVHVHAQLDPAGGALFKAILEALADPTRHPHDDSTDRDGDGDGAGGDSAEAGGDSGDGDREGAGVGTGAVDREGTSRPAWQERTRGQCLADALSTMARLAQHGLSTQHPSAEPTRLVIISTVEQVAHPHPDPHASEPDTHYPTPEQTDARQPGLDDDAEATVPDNTDPESTGASETGEPSATPAPTPGPTPAPAPIGALSSSATERDQPPPTPAPPDPPRPQLPDACAAPGRARALDVGLLLTPTLHQLACDSAVDHVLTNRPGALIAMRTLGRLATPAQLRALAARDGGCGRPGCAAPPSHCQAHHIVWWSRGGRTELDNLILLCGTDHTLIHQEDWRIVMDHGVPYFIPPPWIDPTQTPIRNTMHTAITEAITLGQRLRPTRHAA